MFENDVRTNEDDRAATLLEELIATADSGTRAKLIELDDALINAEHHRMIRTYNKGYADGRQAAMAKKQKSLSARQMAWNLV